MEYHKLWTVNEIQDLKKDSFDKIKHLKVKYIKILKFSKFKN